MIYLMECILFNKQYVGKAETSFNVKLNNHQKDVKNVDAIIACKHFQQESHNFNKHAKFTIIDQLTNIFKSKVYLFRNLKLNLNLKCIYLLKVYKVYLVYKFI